MTAPSELPALVAGVVAAPEAAGAPACPAPIGPRAVLDLAAWLTLVRAWNRKIDLTAAKDDVALAELGTLDAAWLAHLVPAGARVVDVGTGFGAPGLALACLRPDLALTLVEPLGKRVAFLRTVIGSVGLVDRVTVESARGEDLVAAGRRFDVAISRATLAKDAWLALGAALAPRVYVLLGREDLPDSRHAVEVDRDYATAAGAARRVVGFVTAR